MSDHSTQNAPSDRLLRTLASVPVSSSILDLGCGAGHHTEAVLRLGFPVHATDVRSGAIESARERVRTLVDDETAETCVRRWPLAELDAIDETFDWVIGTEPEAYLDSDSDLVSLFDRVERLLTPGGWFYLTLPTTGDGSETPSTNGRQSLAGTDGWEPEALEADRIDTSLVESRAPQRVDEHGRKRVHAIYRRVEGNGPA